MGVEPTSSAWKADVLAVVRHLHASRKIDYSIEQAVLQVIFIHHFIFVLSYLIKAKYLKTIGVFHHSAEKPLCPLSCFAFK